MIVLCFWPTPNGWKISIVLEEMEPTYEEANEDRHALVDCIHFSVIERRRRPTFKDLNVLHRNGDVPRPIYWVS